MGQSITVDIQAKVVGYEASIRQLQTALAKVDPGSEMGKKITTALSAAQKQVTELGKNMFPKASSDAQIDALVEKVNRVGTAIQNVSAMFSNLNIGDLNFDALGSEIQNFQTRINSLQTDLDSKINSGLVNAVQNSAQLKQIFSELGTDMSKATATSLFEDLAKGATQAKDEADKANTAYQKIIDNISKKQTKLAATEASPLGSEASAANIRNEVESLAKQYDDVMTQLRDRMTKGLTTKLAGTGLDPNKFLDQFFAGLTPENLNDKIKQLFETLQSSNIYGKTGDTRNFYNEIFGESARDINGLVKALNLDAQINPVKEKLLSILESLGDSIQPAKKLNLMNLILGNNLGGPDGALAQFESTLDKAINSIAAKIKKAREELAELQRMRADAENTRTTTTGKVEQYHNAGQSLEALLAAEKAAHADTRKELEQTKADLQKALEGSLRTTQSQAAGAGTGAGGAKFPISEANQYKDAISQIAAKEQMLGKMQGVVQRWFSIYAAVRMVSNGIKSMMSTIKELDSTITEIAIVTNKTQPELWAQMPEYTKMARQYASSIAGVYKVSQLYYQQGLGQADVMALSEQTLKMARISGLDYATATDYMTNAVRSFKMEMQDAQSVVDVYSAVAASSATSVSELATAMSKTASSAQAVGSSFENTTAMMAVMIEATRESPENIGSALKSIISRYGELKENKTGMDEEGEEYSLNKVDTALQSVGISIHDANGEFRDFDDVVMELAESWDTIDKNTQRYIATVMAGNRQQSRFLALVSSGERLKELSGKAAESEDASQLQFLKTLDSVDAKTQQLQTSIQALYVNSGLENAYKGILDYANQIVSTFDNLAQNNGLMTAFTKIGTTFSTLATLVSNLFNTIKVRYANLRTEMVAKSKIATEEEIQNARMAELQKENMATAAERAKTDNVIQESQKRKDAYEREATSAHGTKAASGKMKAGMALTAGGLALTTVAASLDVNESRKWKAGFTAAGGILSGVGTAAMVGGPAGALLGLVTALPSVLEALGMWEESFTEKISRLDDKITEGTNERIKAKDELKTLEEYKKRYEEVEAVKDLTPEGREEWIKLNSEIVNTYPQLLSYIDEEGNSIASLGARYDQLIDTKRNAYEQSLLTDIQNHIEAYSNMDYVLKDLISSTANTDTNKRLGNIFFNWDIGSEAAQATQVEEFMSQVSVLMTQAQGDKNLFNSLFQNKFGFTIDELQTWSGMQFDKSTDIINDFLFGHSTVLSDDLFTAVQNSLQVIETNFDYYSNMLSDYIDSVLPTLTSYYGNKSNLEYTNYGMLSTQAQDYLAEQWEIEQGLKENQGLPTTTIMTKFFKKIPQLLETFNQTLIDKGTFLNEDTLAQAEDIVSNTKKYSKNYLDSLRSSNSILSNLISEANWNDIDELIQKQKTSLEKYYDSIIKTAINEGQIDESDLLWYGNLFAELSSTFNDIPLNYQQAYIDQVKSIINSSSYLDSDKQSILTTIVNLRKNILSAYNLTDTQTSYLDNVLSKTDFTTITGIQELQDSLKNIGVNIDLSSLINNILPNIEVEMKSLQEQISTQLTDLDKILSKATKGMDFSDALSLADSLDISLNDKDFSFANGKYFYNNIEHLRDFYLLKSQETLNLLNDKINKQIDIAGSTLDLSDTSAKTLDYLAAIGDSDLLKNDPYKYIFEELGKESDIAQQLASWYKQYYQEFSSQSEYTSFSAFVINKLKTSQDTLNSLTEEYVDYQINKSLLETGQIKAFASKVGHQKSEFTSQAETNVASLIEEKNKEISELDELEVSMTEMYNQRLQILQENEKTFIESKRKELEAQIADTTDIDAFTEQAKSNLNLRSTSPSYYEQQLKDLLYNEEELTAEAQTLLNQVIMDQDAFFFDMAKQALLEEGKVSLEQWTAMSEESRKGWSTYDEYDLNAKKQELQRFANRPDIIDSAESPLNIEYWKNWLREHVGTEEDTDIAARASQAAWDAHLANAEDIIKERDRLIDEANKNNNEIFTQLEELNLSSEETIAAEAKREVEAEFGNEYDLETLEARKEKLRQQRQQLIEDEAQRLADEANQTIVDAITSGDTSFLTGDLAQFASSARKLFVDVWSNINNSMLDAVKGGETGIEVTQANKQALAQLALEHSELLDVSRAYLTENGQFVLDEAGNKQLAEGALAYWNADTLSELTEEQLQDYLKTDTYTKEQRRNLLQSWHEALHPNKVSTIGSMIESDKFDRATLDTYFEQFGDTQVTELEGHLKDYGLQLNEITGEYFIQSADTYFNQLRQDLDSLELDPNSDEYRETLAKINSQERIFNNKRATKLHDNVKNVLDNYDEISEDQYTALEGAVSAEEWAQIKTAFKDLGNGTYKLNVAEFKQTLQALNLDSEIGDLLLESFSNITDDYLKNITDAASYLTKGTTSQADIQQFKQTAKELNLDISDTAFTYDQILDAWTLDPQVMHQYIEAQANQLVTAGLLTREEAVAYLNNNVTQTLLDNVDIKGYIESKDITGKSRNTLKNSMKNVLSAVANWQSEILTDYMPQVAIDADEGAKSSAYASVAAAQKHNENLRQAIDAQIENDIKALEAGGQAAVDVLKAYAGDRELSAEEIEAAYRNRVNDLQAVSEVLGTVTVGTVVSKNVAAKLNQFAGFEVNSEGIVTAVGDMVTAYQAIYNQMVQTAGKTTADLNAAYADLLTAQEQSDIDAIAAMGDAMGMTYSALGEILAKQGISLKEWMDINANEGIYEKIGAGKIRITDFTKFAGQMGWQPGSEEYTSALKSYNDALIELNQQAKTKISDEIKSLSGMKGGDQLNLTELWSSITSSIGNALYKKIQSEDWHDYYDATQGGEYAARLQADSARVQNQTIKAAQSELQTIQMSLLQYGAIFKDGILTLTENANIPAIMHELQSIVQTYGESSKEQLAAFFDALNEFLSSINDLIGKGLEGSLSQLESLDLQKFGQAHGVNLDFTNTAKGMKLTQQSAIGLYQTMQKIDTEAGTMFSRNTFDQLKTYMMENNESYKDASANMQRIVELSNAIYSADSKVSSARLQEYQAELAVAQEIFAVRSTSEDESFKFMENKMPGGLYNPINYMENMGKAFRTLKESFQQDKTSGQYGMIGAQDWYNIATEMGRIAGITGQKFEIAGVELDGSMERTSQLIQHGFDNLSAVDSGELMVSLPKMGFDFESAATGLTDQMDAGIKELSAAEIAQIDAMIAVLEIMVAMEKLGDVAGEDMELTLGDIVIEDPTTGQKEFTTSFEAYQQWYLDAITEGSKNFNADLKKMGDAFKFDGQSVTDMIVKQAAEDWTPDQAQFLNALMKAGQSMDWDVNDVANSMASIMRDVAFPDGATIDIVDDSIGIDMTYYIQGQQMYSINWKGENLTNLVNSITKGAQEQVPTVRENIIEAVKTYNADPINCGLQTIEYALAAQGIVKVDADGKFKINTDTGTYEAGSPEYYREIARVILSQQKLSSNTVVAMKDGPGVHQTIQLGQDLQLDVQTVVDAEGVTQTFVGQLPNGQEWSSEGEPQEVLRAYLKACYDVSDSTDTFAQYAYEHDIDITEKTKLVVNNKEVTDIALSPRGAAALKKSRQNLPALVDQVLQNEANNLTQTELGNTIATIDLGDGVTMQLDISDINLDGADARQQLNDKILQEFDKIEGLDLKQIATIARGIETALSSQQVQGAISQAMADGLAASLGGEEAKPIPIPEVTLEADSIDLELSEAVLGAAEVPSIEVTAPSVTVHASNINVDDVVEQVQEEVAEGQKKGALPPPSALEGAVAVTGGMVQEYGPHFTAEQKKNWQDASDTQQDYTKDIKATKSVVNQTTDALASYVSTATASGAAATSAAGSAAGSMDTVSSSIGEAVASLESFIALWSSLGAMSNESDFNNISTMADSLMQAATTLQSFSTGVGGAIASLGATMATGISAPTTPTAPEAPTGLTQEITFTVNDDAVKSSLSDIDGVVAETRTLQIDANTSAADGKLAALISRINAASGTVNVSVSVSGVDQISTIQTAINNLQDKTVTVTVKESVSSSGGGSGSTTPVPQATGNFGLAHAKSTLMGELGPELVVSSNRYFVAGQNGPEFVDLEDDAIVFNHLQTQQLLKYGMSPTRGQAVTSERAAVAFAKGSVAGGPAMASASAALAALKQIRSMWAALQNMSVKDLAGAGGSGGGGGGGGGDKGLKAFVEQLDRWYDLLQKIARLEKQINFEEARRGKLAAAYTRTGEEYFNSQIRSLDYLKQQAETSNQLATEQQEFFNERRAYFNSEANPYSMFYDFDEYGQQRYKKADETGTGKGGLQMLSELLETDEYGKPKMMPDQQVAQIEAWGLGKFIQYDSSGNEIDRTQEGWETTAVQAFWDYIEAQKQEMQSLYDSYTEQWQNYEEYQQAQYELIKEIKDNQISLENKVLQAFEDMREQEIEAVEDEKKVIEETSHQLLDGLSAQLSRERAMYQQNQDKDELSKLQRQLAILQRSGGSSAQISSLRSQISDKTQELYFEEQQSQIDALQEAVDNEIQRLDTQIEIMKDTLEYEKEHGMLWAEVYKVMDKSPEEITTFIKNHTESYWGKSPTDLAQTIRGDLFEADQYVAWRNSVNNDLDKLVNHFVPPDNPPAEEQAQEQQEAQAEANEQARERHERDQQRGPSEEDIERMRREAVEAAANAKHPDGPSKPYDLSNFKVNNGANEYAVATPGSADGQRYKIITEGEAKQYQRQGVTVMSKYDIGGMVDEDKFALVHAKEAVLTPEQTKMFREDLLGESKSSVVNQLKAVTAFFDKINADRAEMTDNFSSFYSRSADGLSYNGNNAKGYSVWIENAAVNMQVEKIANDYDARRAGEQALDEMMQIAKKTQGWNRVRR